jgi:nickel-type superoxide dismutase maturation protease
VSLAVASVLGALVALRPVRRLEVAGPSMLPALAPGDRLAVVRVRLVRAGDLAVFRDPREPSRLVVKRVVEATEDGVTVHGDNVAASTDSRAYGPLPAEAIWGRAVYRYAPPSCRGRIGRVGTL